MLYTNCTAKLLGLEGVIVENIIHSENFMSMDIELKRKYHKCPACGAETNSIHDYRRQKIKDIPAFGKQVLLYLRKRRYRCPHCGKRFFEQNNFLPKYYRMTNRLCAYIINQLSDVRSFTGVAREVNLSVSTVIRIFDHVQYSPRGLSSVLSIDEFKGNTAKEKYQCIITDPVNRRIVDILPTRDKLDLITYFKKFDRSRTKYFISDMWNTYADISNVFFKNATFVVDKYHYIRQVIWAFEAVRKEIQKQLSPSRCKYFKRSRSLLNKRFDCLDNEQKQQVDIMLLSSDKLSNAYWLKESFLRILDCKDSSSARQELSNWVMAASSSGINRFEKCAKTMVNWSVGILNSFDCDYTNGFTEGCNNKIKVLKRNAYGYRNFNRFRNRILHVFNHKNEVA